MRITTERGRIVWTMALALLASGALASAQGQRGGRGNAAAPAGKAAAAANPEAGVARLQRLPVNPNDPVAIINGEPVTRQRLADECLARKGEEILETLIARTLIEQAMKRQKQEVTSAEIDAEIERVAMSMAGVTKEQWLRTLAKERNISPAQYARDIIYPALALRKLAAPRVVVTDEDMKDAYESQFGEQLSYRMIMTRSVEHAKQLWEELKKNPGGFENMARNDPRSIDPATRADGGKPVGGPLRRHSYPRHISDEIFKQLVDGDPDDKNTAHKPADGAITGPIQITEDAWILVKRDGLIAGQPYDTKDPVLAKQMRDAIFESKIQQHMEQLYAEIIRASAIENKLTGTIKTANQDLPKAPVDGQVQLMGQRADAQRAAGAAPGTAPAPATTPTTGAGRATLPIPPGVDPADVQTREAARVNTQPEAKK
jgi:hypothetical protein